MTNQTNHKTKILIVGGGFGGLRAARKLAAKNDLEVTLVSAEDSFAYYPQLYHAATGGARTESAIPLTEILTESSVRVVKDTVVSLDPHANTAKGTSGSQYSYDKVILALGSVTNYFGITGLEEFSFNIKTIAGAEEFKQYLHKQIIDESKTDTNYVVVGGGPTGIELAGALGDYLRRITKLHGLVKPTYKVELVEAAPHLLPRSPEAMGQRIQKRLEAVGVTVMAGAVVQAETAAALQLAGQSIASKTVVWTAGVANNPFFKANSQLFSLAKNGKVEVDEHLQAGENIYVIGDNAATQYSGMAQTAIHNADFVVRDISEVIRGADRKVYRPKAPVSVIPVGNRWSAAQWGPVLLYGYAGYVLRRLADLVGYADMESWPKAVKVWLEDSRREDNCAICQPPAGSAKIERAQ